MSLDFKSDVVCEHVGLVPDKTKMKLVSSEVIGLFNSGFGSVEEKISRDYNI